MTEQIPEEDYVRNALRNDLMVKFLKEEQLKDDYRVRYIKQDFKNLKMKEEMKQDE